MKSCFLWFESDVQMLHMVCVCCWCWFSAEQVQIHNLPLGGDKKPKDSSKVVYTLLDHPRHWPGGGKKSGLTTLLLCCQPFYLYVFFEFTCNIMLYDSVSVPWSAHNNPFTGKEKRRINTKQTQKSTVSLILTSRNKLQIWNGPTTMED